jgi:anaerobic magnesium-protoporphyrin IX monomethyl ester cyclase
MRFETIVVINPPSPPGYVANRDSMGGYGQLYPIGATPFPPLDVPYLAAFLIGKGIAVEVLEAVGLDLKLDELVERVARITSDEPATVLVTMRAALCSLDWDLSVCAAIRQANPEIKLAIYGPVLSYVNRRVEQEGTLDYIIRGEPDDTVFELANGRAEGEILGLTYRRNGTWVECPPRPFSKELDRLPFPKWELLPYRRYALPRSSTTGSLSFLPMLTSRGCPFGCHYCPYPLGQGLPFRFRSPKNVVDEIEHLINDLGIQYILFRDPMFTLHEKRVVQICNEIQKRGLKFRWKCETRPDCVTAETLSAMAAAGCEGVNFGVESAEVTIQAGVGRRPITPDKITEMVSVCRRLGIKTFCFFIIGLPGDTVQSVLETIQFGIRLRCNWIQFNAASPMIGTKLRDWAIAKGLTPDNEYSYRSSHEAMIGNDNLTKDQVRTLHRFATLFERYLINRGGVLKDDNRGGLIYGAARSTANIIADLAARVTFAIGRSYFQHVYTNGEVSLLNKAQFH